MQLVDGTYWGLHFVDSNGSDGLLNGQFKRIDVYSSPNGKEWTFVRVAIDREDHPELLDARLTSRQFTRTPNGSWAFYLKNQYAATARKNLLCLHSPNIDGPYTMAFTVRPYGYSSGDLGLMHDGGKLYIISAATNEGEINIFRVTNKGDELDEHTANLSWNLAGGAEDHREAPSIFKRNGLYYITTSGKTGWKPNRQKYAYSPSLTGPWSPLYDLGDETGFHSQLFFVATNNRSSLTDSSAPPATPSNGAAPAAASPSASLSISTPTPTSP